MKVEAAKNIVDQEYLMLLVSDVRNPFSLREAATKRINVAKFLEFLVLDVKHWTGNRIDFASVSTDLLPHEADIGDRECREGQGQQTDQVGPDKQQTLSQRQIAAQCADQLCV